jgi:hypothetical protein
MTSRWLKPVLSLVAAAAIGLATWQIVTTDSQLRETRQQLASLRKSDNIKLALVKATEKYVTAELITAQRTLQAMETTTTLPPTAPFAFVDPATVQADLEAAESAVSGQLGYNIGLSCWPTSFLDEFTALEQQETSLAEQGKPYFVPDASSDAYTFIGLNQSCPG